MQKLVCSFRPLLCGRWIHRVRRSIGTSPLAPLYRENVYKSTVSHERRQVLSTYRPLEFIVSDHQALYPFNRTRANGSGVVPPETPVIIWRVTASSCPAGLV